MIKKKSIYLLLAAAGVLSLPSCNADSSYETAPADLTGVAVTGFSLQSDKTVLNNLDSVFFSINLKDAMIFNADSLPYGTDVSSLSMTITTDACSELKIYYTDKDGGESSLNYLDSPNDAVDFSKGDARLHIVSYDGQYSRDYTVKVNVHKMVPDSLYWAKVDKAALPTSLNAATSQKTVKYLGKAYCLTTDGTAYSMAVNADPYNDKAWQKSSVTFPENVDVRSLTATDSRLCILTVNGKLLWSTDGATWTDSGDVWSSITTSYEDILLGVKKIGDDYYHAFFPDRNCVPEKIDAGFPVSGNAGAVVFDSKWSAAPQVMTFGGRKLNGELTGATWSFDGKSWAMLGERLPAGEGYAVADYVIAETDTVTWRVTESHVILAIGGFQSGSKVSRDVYFSRDYGVNWHKAYDELLLPEYIPAMWNADMLVFDTTLPISRGVESGWIEMPVRSFAVAGSRAVEPITSWECPYLYMFGGIGENGRLQPDVWRGVVNHLSFRPLQ